MSTLDHQAFIAAVAAHVTRTVIGTITLFTLEDFLAQETLCLRSAINSLPDTHSYRSYWLFRCFAYRFHQQFQGKSRLLCSNLEKVRRLKSLCLKLLFDSRPPYNNLAPRNILPTAHDLAILHHVQPIPLIATVFFVRQSKAFRYRQVRSIKYPLLVMLASTTA